MPHPCTPPFPRYKPSLAKQEQICTSNQSVSDWSPFAQGRTGWIHDSGNSDENKCEGGITAPPRWNCKYDSLLKRNKKPEQNMENIHSINKKIDSLLGVLNEASQPQRQYHFAENKLNCRRGLTVSSQENPIESEQPKIERYRQAYGTPLRQTNRQARLSNSLNYSGLSSIKNQRQSGHATLPLREFTIGVQRNATEKIKERVKMQELGSKSVIINGKNIDDQISKIQGRINEMQKMKRQMNLNASVFLNPPIMAVQQDVPLPKPFREFYQKRRKNQLRGKESLQIQPSQQYSQPIKQIQTGQYNRKQVSQWGLKHLLVELRTQISLDERFRQLKQWFYDLRNFDKWRDLEEILKQQQIYIDEQCTRMIFGITHEETSPFDPPMDCSGLLELVQAFLQCQSNWSSKIANKHSVKLLASEGLNEKALDLGCRGYITFQDFVGFFNIEMDAVYRQRELYLVYDRIKKGEHLHFQDLLLTLCV